MEVILRDDVENLGSRGQVVRVANGYARNYLLPKRLAVTATEGNKKIIEQEKEAWLRREAKAAEEASELAKLMGKVALTIQQKAGAENQLFGSVTAQNIADALGAQGYTVDRKKIHLDGHIKMLGEYTVEVKLHQTVSVNVPLKVVNEEGEIPALSAPEPEPKSTAAAKPAKAAKQAAVEEAEATEEPEADDADTEEAGETEDEE